MSGLQSLLKADRHIDLSGRWYCYTDNRWICANDDNYGSSYYQFAEPAGTNDDPLIEWEHLGHLIMPGERITSLVFAGQSNNTTVTDFELTLSRKVPTPVTRWETGVDADAEFDHTEIFRGKFLDTFTGNSNDMHLKVFEVVGDQPLEHFSMLSTYGRPLGTITATRYYRTTYLIGVSR